MRNVLFYERQSFSRVLFALALLLGLAGLAAVLPAAGGDGALAPARGLAGFAMLVLAVFVLNVLTITTWVYDDTLRVQLGRVFPLRNTRIRLVAVESMDAIESSEFQGLRAREREGGSTVFIDTRAPHAVHLRTADRSYFIGTRYPEKLLECIRAAQENGEGAG